MIEIFRRFAVLHFNHDVNGMSLIGADFCAIGVEAVASLAVGFDNLFQQRAVNVIATPFVNAVHQLIDIRPPADAFDSDPDCFGIVTKNQTQEAAQSDIFFL